MTARLTCSMLVLLAFMSARLVGQDHKHEGKEGDKHAGFEQLKRLVGEWIGKGESNDGPPVHVVYRLTAGGSAVVETLFPGTDHEMVSVIHRDGGDLLLTHYCHLGNQPHLKAAGTGAGKKIEFKFVRATNLKSPNDLHMHEVSYAFVDSDTLRTDVTIFSGGKAAKQMSFELKRKK
jgi:hypothetical protein